jgi:small subunit ribosomal protein S2
MTFELKNIAVISIKTTLNDTTEKYQFILKMVKSGVHFGHKIKNWNPKMAPFIYQKLQGIHIIDIIQSYTYLKKICKILYNKAGSSNYSTFLFVGTQKQSPIPNCINSNASKCNSFFIDNKWLSGMLTNWSNTNGSINTLKYLQMYRKTKNFNKLSMKLRSMIEKKYNKLEKYFGGIKNMVTLPDVVILVGQHTEITASKECKKLGISNVTILDTDCNPDLVDLFIPGNDDSSSSLNLLLGELQMAINLGRQKFCGDISISNKSNSIIKILE